MCLTVQIFTYLFPTDRMYPCLIAVVTLAAIVLVGIAVPSVNAQGTPIVYNGTLSDGEPFFGSVSTLGDTSNPELAQYFSLFGSQGEQVTISVPRGDAAFDPAFYIYEGLFENTDEFGGFFDAADPRFIVFADDELDPATGIGTGPFGDPSATIILPTEGVGAYTLAVVNFLSDPIAGDSFGFSVQPVGNLLPPTAVPEPSSTFAIAASGLVLLRRRRSNTAC